MADAMGTTEENRFMRRSLLFILVGSFGLLACTRSDDPTSAPTSSTGPRAGGQSGTEATPIDCGTMRTRSVAPDEETPVGNAKGLFDSIEPWTSTATLRWYSYDGAPSYSDTTLTFFLTGTPSTVTYTSWSRWDDGGFGGDACGPTFDADGAVLHFKTSDGAFDESIPGFVHHDPGLTPTNGFNAYLTADFGGTYDTAGIAQRFGTSDLWLFTGFDRVYGWIIAKRPRPADADANWGMIASWTGTTTYPGTGGVVGVAGSGGGTGSDASAGGGGTMGSGGATGADASTD